MEATAPVPEFVKVILRIRPRVDTLPNHAHHGVALANSAHDPDCLVPVSRHQIKFLPQNLCKCDICFSKAKAENLVAEKFGGTVGREKKDKFYRFDGLLQQASTQDDVYASVVDVVNASVQGYNATIFAYGSTGTGKTYTMNGTKNAPGIIPRAIDEVFRSIESIRIQKANTLFHIELSYIEMYNNGFRNLLRHVSDAVGRIEEKHGSTDMIDSELDELLQVGMSDVAFEAGISRLPDLSHNLDKITVHEGTATGVFLCGPNVRIPVNSASAAQRLFTLGNRQRAETGGKFNSDPSSRSHSIFTIHVEGKLPLSPSSTDSPSKLTVKIDPSKTSSASTPKKPAFELRLGKINLVDLAGSERLSETKAEGDLMTETQNINKSLLALGEVLHALALNASIQSKNDRIKKPDAPHSRNHFARAESPSTGEMHVPYLNSKLSHVLKDSLGGNSKTIMIANVGTEVEHYGHIQLSLNYASRAMKVRNLVSPNRIAIAETDLPTDLTNERDVINQLKDRVLPRGSNGPQHRPPTPTNAIRNASPSPRRNVGSNGSVVGGGSVSGRSSSPAVAGGSVVSQSSAVKRRQKTAPPVSFPAPAAIPSGVSKAGPKTFALKLTNIQAQHLNYVSFPLCPVLKFKVDSQESATSKNLYARSLATFPETLEFEVNVLKYKAGLELEVEAVNVSPLTGLLEPIGEGRVNLQGAVDQLNANKTLTIELTNSAQQPAGLVLVGATLLDRAVGTSVSYPQTQSLTGPFSPVRPSSRQTAPRTKNGVFKVERVVCHEMVPPFVSKNANNVNPPAKGEYYVVVQVGSDSLRTDPVECKSTNNTVYVAYDCPDMIFDVEFEELPAENIRVDVFEVTPKGKNGKRLVGRARAPLHSLVTHNDGLFTPATEFAMQLKDENDVPAGKVSLFLLLSKENGGIAVDSSRGMFDSPGKTGRGSPSKSLRNNVGMSPRLNNVIVPAAFHTGWIRISSIVATNLNKFRLVGNSARYKHLREAPASTPVPAYLKNSELQGRQDPFVVVEAGEFWGSYSKVLLNQGFNCQWDQAAFCCYMSNLDASEQDMKVTVYDRSVSGFHNVFIGFASVPLVNFFAPQRTKDSVLELSVVDRRGKPNGKLELKYTWEASDEKERWSNGIISKVLGDGCYNVRYEDGEEEFGVSKDVIRLLSRSATLMPPRPPASRRSSANLFAIKEGNRVEVNDQGKGLWYPAWVVSHNEDGTYDIDSDYEVLKLSVELDHLRLADGTVPPAPKRTDSSRELVNRRLNYDESVVSNAGCKNKYALRQTVEGNYKSKNKWYPGKIFKIHYYEQYCTYDIDYLTGEFESEVAEDMIRIESTREVPEDATSAYELRVLRAQRPESNVVPVPLHRSNALTGTNATGAGRNAQGVQKTKSKFQVSDDVEVNYRGHGVWYPCSVEVDYENGVYDILYNTTGERDLDISEDLIRAPLDPDAARSARNTGTLNKYRFEVGDRIEANYREIGKFVPGIITRDRGHGVFDVQYYDGRLESRVNFELIRMADPNAIFSPAQRPSKYVVGDSVESNCEGLGVWYHALVRNVLPDGLYNIQYDDGETEYDVDEEQLRAGGAYAPGIPSLKPFFKVGDKVKVACRSIDVEHEIRSLSAIKQRIMEERKKLAEGKLAVAKRAALFDSSKDAAEAAHKALQGFKTHVGYSGDLSCCQAENASGEESTNSPATDVSPTSFKKLDEIDAAFNPSDETKETDVVETLNDAVTKAIVVEQSLGHIAGAAKDEELAKAENAQKLAVLEKEKADELALARAIEEGKARKRNNYSREEELRAFKEIYQKAELELGHIMAARQLVLEHDEALKIAKQKADLEAKCIAGAKVKGEKATIRIRAEDRARVAAAEVSVKDTRTAKHASKTVPNHSKKEKTPSQKVQKSLGPDVARERDALRLSLIRVKEANEQLLAAKARAEQAGKEYAAAESKAEVSSKDLNVVLETNRRSETTLTESSMLAKEFKEYIKATDAIAAYLLQANGKASQKITDERKAEAATSLRRRKEEGAAVYGEKRILAEESMIRSARNSDMQSAKSAIKEANSHADKQGDEVLEAAQACDTETKELVKATRFAEDENKLYVTAKDIAVLAAGLLRVIIADQREREYSQLGEVKQMTEEMTAELARIREHIAARDLRRVNTTAAAQTEAQAIVHIKTRVSVVRTTEVHTSTMEKTALSLRVLKSQNGRAEAELEMTRISQTRIALEERATASYKRVEIEESIATACAAEDVERDAAVDTEDIAAALKREQLTQFTSYSAEECAAVRNATMHAQVQFEYLQEAKALALRELETIDACRSCAEEEFEALSALSGVERNDLSVLVDAKPLDSLQESLAYSKAHAIDANRSLHMCRQKTKDLRKDLQTFKESTVVVLEELTKAQSVTQHLTTKDFGLDRNKVSAVEGAQNAVKSSLTTAVAAEKARMEAEEVAEQALKNSEEASQRASAADRLCLREEESSRQASVARGGISMTVDEHEVHVSLIAAITHSTAHVEALHQAVTFTEREIESLTLAKAQASVERKSLLAALAKEEKILLIKAQRDQELVDTELATAKRVLDLRITLSNDAQQNLERETLALDVAIIALERAAKELVTRGDDDIDEFRAYQREFKRLMCKRQKAAEAHKRNLALQAKTEIASKAREAEEESAIATENKVYALEKQAARAEQDHDSDGEIKALREARKLYDECTNALSAAGEYAAAEDSLYEDVQKVSDDERRALSAARDHAEESHRLLMKALSVLPLQHRTCMGLMLLNGGQPYFKGVPVRPRKMESNRDNDDGNVDPNDLHFAHNAFDDVSGNVDQKAADFKDDEVIPDQDSKEMSWQFDANPLRAALRGAVEEVNQAHELLDSAKARTDDAENRYRQANAIAVAEGQAVAAQEEQNAATSYRLYDNFVGVEDEHAQLQKVRTELGYEDKTTANLRLSKEAEVKKVPPLALNRQRYEETAAEAAQSRAAAVEKALQARGSKDPKRMDSALKEAKKFCDMETSALNDAAQYAAKECAAWTNGTGVANKETTSAEKAHVLADEEARLLEMIRAAQLNQGIEAYKAAKKHAEVARDGYDDVQRGMAGFADLIEELRVNNNEREAELTEETKSQPAYRPYKEVRAKFDTENKRAQAAHANSEAEVDKALAASQLKEEAGAEAVTNESKRLEEEHLADEAAARGDKAGEREHSDKAKAHEAAVTAAYQRGTQAGLTEAGHWKAAAQWLEAEKEALTAAHVVSLDATALLVQLRDDQIERELSALRDANQVTYDCANNYEAAHRRSLIAADVLARSRALLATREAVIGEDVKTIPEYNLYLDFVDSMGNADDQANAFEEEKLKERAEVDVVIASKQQEEKVAIAAGVQRAAATEEVRVAQANNDVDAEMYAMDSLKKHCGDEEDSLMAARQIAAAEATKWSIATDLANEETNSRIAAKDHCNNAIRLLNALRLDKEHVDLDSRKGEAVDAEQAYHETRKTLLETKARTAELIAKSQMSPDVVSPEVQGTAAFNDYIHKANALAAESKRPSADHDAVNAPAIAGAKNAAVSRRKEEVNAGKEQELRTPAERSTVEMQKRGELERESKALTEANAHLDEEEKSLIAATQYANEEVRIWKSLKSLADNDLRNAIELNERAEEAGRMLGDLMLNEKERLATAIAAAIDQAVKAENEYHVTNKKTLSRLSTLKATIHKTEGCAKSLPEAYRSTPEFEMYTAQVGEHPVFDEEAQLVKKEKDGYVITAEATKQKRLALEAAKSSSIRTPKARGTVKDLAAKYDKDNTVKKPDLTEAETNAMAQLLTTAQEETAAWTAATSCTIEEKEAYTQSVDIFEQGLLLLAAAKVNQHERDILAKLNKAEVAAGIAKDEYFVACAKVDAQEQELSARHAQNSLLEAEVMSQDEEALSSAPFVRAKERLQKEESRASAAREARTTVVEKATALFESRNQEISVADDCVGKMRRIVVLDTATPPSGSEPHEHLSAITRLDVVYWEVNSKARSPTGTEDIRDEAVPVFESIENGSHASYKDLRGVYPDFGVGKRDKVSTNANMLALNEEQVYAVAEERALGAATNHAIDEEQTWRLALKHAVIEAEALADACTKADEASRALAGVKDNINERQKSMLDAANADAQRDADRFAHTDRECAELAKIFEQKKVEIAAKDVALDDECREYSNYHLFEDVNRDLKENREPTFLTARQAKFAAAGRANGWGAQKAREMEEASAAEKGGRETQMQQARVSAYDSATKESAAWAEGEKHAADELAALTVGVTQEDEALRLLNLVKAEFEDDSVDVAEREAGASRQKYGLSFKEAEMKGKIFREKLDTVAAKDAELLPESKELPVYKKYYKLRSELENDDEPLVLSRRDQREAAAQEAEKLVIANKLNKPTVVSAEGERVAWDKAGSRAGEEVQALDVAIAKATTAIELLDAVKLEELRRQGNADEKDLWDSKARTAEAQAALAATEAKIKAARSDLNTRKSNNVDKADLLLKKGPEFAGEVEAHRESLRQIDSNLNNAESHRSEKQLDIDKAVQSNEDMQRAEELAGQQDGSRDGSTRRRDALVAANQSAEAERSHYEDATVDAEAELAALEKARAAAQADEDALNEGHSARAYRSRFGYLLLGGGDGLINVPKRRPFDNVPEKETPKFIDFTKMKTMNNASDFEPMKEVRKAMSSQEASADDWGDDSRDPKVLFELGGGWSTAIAAQAKKVGPYNSAKPEEYMPAILVTSDISKEPRRARARKVQAPTASFFQTNEDGSVSHERLRGKALFIAAARHLMKISTVVRHLKPLGEGELEKLKQRIEQSTGTVKFSSHFLEDNSVLQSRAGKQLVDHHGSPVRGDGEFDMEDGRAGSPSRFAATERINTSIESFLAGLQKRSTSMDNLASMTSTTTTEGVSGSSMRNRLRGAANKVMMQNRVAGAFSSIGADSSNFKKSEQVTDDSIMSFLFGGKSKDVDAAVLEDEEEDVVEHVKETHRETTQSVERRQEQTVENHSSEEANTVEMKTSSGPLNVTNGKTSQPQKQIPSPVTAARAASDDAADWDDGDGDFGTAYHDLEATSGEQEDPYYAQEMTTEFKREKSPSHYEKDKRSPTGSKKRTTDAELREMMSGNLDI